MNNLTEAIETIQDMLDVAKKTGSAYVYTHNGGDERIRNVLDQLQAYKELVEADREGRLLSIPEPEEISPLDYTIIKCLETALKKEE